MKLAYKNAGVIVAASVSVAVLTLCTAAPVAAQVRTLTLNRQSGGMQKQVPVSGGIRVGVMALNPGRVDRLQAVVALPKDRGRYLCVEVSSKDGLYSALFSHQLTASDAGMVKGVLDDADIRKLTPPEAADVAILASLSDDCQAPTAPVYLVSAWAGSQEPDEDSLQTMPISVLLNSRVPTFLRIEDAPGNANAGPIPCARLEGVTTAFNLRCDIPRSRVTQDVMTLAIVQRRGRSESTVPLTLRAR